MDTSTNWPAIISVVVAIVAAIVGASTAYLSLFIKAKLGEHEDRILDHIDKKFALKEIVTERFARTDDKIQRHEDRIGKLEGRPRSR